MTNNSLESNGARTGQSASPVRILVTGGTGLIGARCVGILSSGSENIHVISRQQTVYDHEGVTYHEVDLLDHSQVKRTIAAVRPTHLLHLAWDVSGDFRNATNNVKWVHAGYELTKHFVEQGGRRAVFAGTCLEYIPRSGLCTVSQTALQPNTLYGSAKNMLRQLVESVAGEEFTYAWARVFFAYGPNENKLRLVPAIIRPLLQGKLAPCSAGRQVRDYLHVYDIASALVRLLESSVSGPVNIGSGRPVQVRDIIGTIARLVGRPELVNFGAFQSNSTDPDFIVADTERLQDEVGWAPVFTLDSGLRHTINWWKREMQINEPVQ